MSGNVPRCVNCGEEFCHEVHMVQGGHDFVGDGMIIKIDANTIEELFGQLIGAASSTRFWDQLPESYPYGAGIFIDQNGTNLVNAGLIAYQDLLVKAGMQVPMIDSANRVGFNEDTLHKVYAALEEAGLSKEQSLNAVNQMQNKGILFRERI